MNIQTIPRKDKVVKAAFVPKLDAIMAADYPNIELKVLAMLLEGIGWPSMADVFRDGADLHLETASGLMGKPVSEITDEERQIGKVYNFSIVYGGGMPTLMEQLGLTAPEALDSLRRFHGRWPGIGWNTKSKPANEGTLVRMILDTARKPNHPKATPLSRGYVTTFYGRHLHPKADHAALNNVCQGNAADLMKWAMVRVHQGLKAGGFQSHIINMIHDDLMLDCVAAELPELNRLLPEWMTDPRIDAIVPIRPECELTFTTWAAKRPYEEALTSV